MSSSRRTSKPPRPFESLASFRAAKKTYCSIDYQIECLNELYNQLMPQNNPKVLQQLRELKANLRSNYGSPRDFPPLERLKVVVMFDDHKEAFFDIRLRPGLGYPKGYPFFIDDSEGTIAGLSEVIYRKVLKAVQEEEEKKEEESNNKSLNHNNNSHAAEDGLVLVNIKQEVDVDEEEEDGLIQLDDDSDEEPLNNELQQEEEIYNSPVNPLPPPPDNNALSADFISLANSAAAAATASSSSVASVPPENGPAMNSQATDIDTNSSSSSNNNTAEQNPRQSSLSSGLTVRVRRPSERQSEEALPIKLEPTESSTVTITRVSRPPSNRAPPTGHEEALTAAAAASVAVSPAPTANVRVLQVNLRPPNVFPSKSKPQWQLPFPHHNISTTSSAQPQRQQPPAAAAVVESGTLRMEPTENSNTYRILNNNNNKRPAGNSNAAQPSPHSQDNPKRAKVSAAAAVTYSSTQARARSQASIAAEHFLASAAFLEAAEAQKLACPFCEKSYGKAALSDHLELDHNNRSQYEPYRCIYPGCKFTSRWCFNVRLHVREKHGCLNGEQYIGKAAAEAAVVVVVPTARTAGSPSLASSSSSSSAAAANRATTTTTASTTSTSTPSAASTSQQQQQQHQRPSTSASTAQTLSVEEYLRAHCPDYVAAKTAHTWVKCPDLKCSKSLPKYQLKDHYLSNHRGLKPYQCQWPGCGFASSWQASAAQHVKGQHNGSYAQYIVYREE
ncbi:hypothetical protein TYRP_001527 [Tyrophagus putrescentiae]|nr:hypothetical protein TYRP_001527 [Tyrophagus putrescentiae]